MTEKYQAPLQGQCLCGAIKYQVDAIGPKMGHCHCSMCRKFHGAAFATYGEATKTNFKWLEGAHLLKAFKAPNGTVRQFCENCGSSMTFQAATGIDDVVEFSLGTLDSYLDAKPDVHIYTESKASWYDISDALPQFKAGRGGEVGISRYK